MKIEIDISKEDGYYVISEWRHTSIFAVEKTLVEAFKTFGELLEYYKRYYLKTDDDKLCKRALEYKNFFKELDNESNKNKK